MRNGGWFAGVMIVFLAAPAFAQSAALDPEMATQAYIDTLSGAARARSDAYFEGGYWLLLWNALVAIAINVALLLSGAARRMADAAARVRRGLSGRTFLFGTMYIAFTALLTLPFTLWEDHYREHLYSLSNQTLAAFLGDWGKQTLIACVLNAALFVPILLLIRRTRAWWAWGTMVVMAGTIVVIAAGPVLLEPLFNDYKPLAAGPLREDILSLARANGVPADDVFVVDASRQTKRISANVAGLFGTTRIALNDNLLETRDPAAIRAVMAHEIGHYALGHIGKLLLQLALLIGAVLGTVAFVLPALLRRYGARWRVEGMNDPAMIPAAVIVITVAGLLATPVFNTIIRTQEVEADIYGLNAAREPDGFARVAMLLSQYRKIEPGAWEERIFFDHPSGRRRVAMAMRWKAEELRRQGRGAAPLAR